MKGRRSAAGIDGHGSALRSGASALIEVEVRSGIRLGGTLTPRNMRGRGRARVGGLRDMIAMLEDAENWFEE
jgi:hypothetical protein